MGNEVNQFSKVIILALRPRPRNNITEKVYRPSFVSNVESLRNSQLTFAVIMVPCVCTWQYLRICICVGDIFC